MSVAETVEKVRLQAPTRETIYYLYVIDDSKRLIGLVSLKDLIMAKPTQLVRDIMHEDGISADANEDQEPVARKIENMTYWLSL